MSRHPVEALLRPPVELWSAVVALATAGIAVLAPWALMMPPGVAYGAAGVLALLGIVRGLQAWRVLTYQRLAGVRVKARESDLQCDHRSRQLLMACNGSDFGGQITQHGMQDVLILNVVLEGCLLGKTFSNPPRQHLGGPDTQGLPMEAGGGLGSQLLCQIAQRNRA